MRDKQKTKDQVINELTKLRQRIAKSEKSETRHKQAKKTLSKREGLYPHTYSSDKIKDLKPGDHLCCLYRTEEEHMSLFTPFLRQGLEQHEKVVYIVDTHTAKAVLDYLRNDGVEVDTYLKSGQLSILTVHETYMRAGIFDPDRMITLLKTETERALAEGYSALRLTGEMSWALHGLSGSERLIEYETKLNKVLPGSKCLAMCQYDCGQFNSKLILDVIATHPIVVFGTEIYDNFYYMLPKDFLGPDRYDAMLRNWITNLADRNQMEDALRESEERFRHIFEQSPLGICIESLDGKIIACNKALEATTGYSFRELKKINLADLYENKEDNKALLKVIMRNGHVVDYQVRLKRKDGTPFDALLSISRINLGGMDFLHTISQDITKRKQAEEELREKEEFNFALFQHNPIQTLVVDRGGRVLKVNMAKRKSGDKLPNIGDVMYKDYAAKHKIDMHAELMECIRSDKAKSFSELKYNDKFLNISIAPFPKGAIITSQDTTERKRVEEEKDKLLKTIETTKEAINIATSEAIMIYTNDAMDRLFGYKKGELIGKYVSVLNAGTPRAAKKIPGKITGAIKKKGVWEGEIHNKRKDGTEFISLAKISALIDKTGKIINYVSSQHDITERKKAEEELKSSQEQLRNLTAHLQSVREEERMFIAREMHDELGQALTALKMDLSWLDNRLPKDQKSLLEKTKSMSKLADATLQTVKRISTELRPGLLDDLGLPAAIEWQAEEFQTRTGIKCEITVDPEDIILDKDRSTAIFRIFQETLTNVARHAKATKVKVGLKEKAGKIELKVRDNGKGITEKQVSDPKSFGLIGIKERAYYLDGKVVIKGLQDKGTTLTIRIPLPKKGKTR